MCQHSGTLLSLTASWRSPCALKIWGHQFSQSNHPGASERVLFLGSEGIVTGMIEKMITGATRCQLQDARVVIQKKER